MKLPNDPSELISKLQRVQLKLDNLRKEKEDIQRKAETKIAKLDGTRRELREIRKAIYAKLNR